MISRLLPLIAGYALSANTLAAPKTVAFDQDPVALTQHKYVAGERLSYFFEDTETTFDAASEDGVLQPKTLKQVQELQISFSISIKANPSGKLSRVLRFEKGLYREGEPTSFSTAPLRALSDVIPQFPADFSYEYQSDSQAISGTALAYARYMGDPIGAFVYYKALDIHTIQSIIDTIPQTLKPGEFIVRPASDIKLPAGIFHNANAAILYQRIESCAGGRCAVFKVVTMGNSFTMATGKLFTNYQYTFYVPLTGPKTGLLLRGELQETVAAPPKTIIQRQLSMELGLR